MVNETPQIVIKKREQEPAASSEFNFSKDKVRMDGNSKTINQFREKALKTYLGLPMPTTKDEPWRRTGITLLQANRFKIEKKSLNNPPEELTNPLISEQQAGQIILTTGASQIHLETPIKQKGVIFTDLITAEREHPDLLEKVMGQIVKPEDGKFAALAAAFSQTGIFLYVPKHTAIDLPFHTLLWGSGDQTAIISHLIIYLDEGSSATYIHETASSNGPEQSLHAGNIEILVCPNASLKFVELQSWAENVWDFSHEKIRVEENGNVEWIFGALGSHVSKHFSTIDLVGIGAEGKVSGFYFTNNQQHLDLDTQQNHLASHTTSDLIFKGALSGASRTVWQGMIYVAKGADKADGYQANRNMILSQKARADSIPGLEILADDVRCTHGATIGKVDPEQVFYLQSRGIPQAQAEQLIVEGFFDQIMQRIPFDGIRQRFERTIHQRMKSLIQ